MSDNSQRLITADALRSCLEYEPETGIFRWRLAKGRRVKTGQTAGSLGGHGYWQIQIDGRLYLAHRLAWLYVTNEWPAEVVDHINMVRSDNRWANLRGATSAQNSANQPIRNTNSTGTKGVCFDRTTGLWRASVTSEGKRTQISSRDRDAASEHLRAIRSSAHGAFSRH